MKDVNVFESFINSFAKEMNSMGHANLIIAGKTGVGKSTLLNSAFRENVAKTGIGVRITEESDVKWYEKEGVPLRVYDTIGLELDEKMRKTSLEMIKKVCQDAKRSNDPDKFIHVMWYCVSCNSDRLEKFEVEYINSIAEEIPVILVITKAFRKRHAERLLNAIKNEYPMLNIKNTVIVLAQDEDPDDCEEDETPKKAFGVDLLIEITAQVVPEGAQKAWCNAQKASIKMKTERAQKLVMTTAAASFGEGYMPLPFSDAIALVPTQLAMLAGITAIFGINVSEDLLKAILTSLAGTVGTTFAGRTIVSNILKMIPGVGTALGGTISGSTAAVLTVSLGETFIQIMRKIAEGELKEKDLASKEVQDELLAMFKERINKKADCQY